MAGLVVFDDSLVQQTNPVTASGVTSTGLKITLTGITNA